MFLGFGSVVAAAGLAAPVVAIESALDCPAPGQVSEELGRILPNAAGSGTTDRALVSSEGGVLLVLLRAADGTLLGERSMTADGSCDERARAVAVVLGTWLTDIHPEYRSSLPAPSPAVAAPSPPAEANSAGASPAVLPPVPVSPPATALDSKRPSDPVERRWSGALGLGVEVSDAGAVFAGALSASYAPSRTGLGASAFALLAVPAERSLGTGAVSSFRWPLGVGPLFRVQARSAFLDVSVGPTLGWLHLAGDGFSENRAANDVATGAFGRARLGLSRSRFFPFLEAGLLGWFGSAIAVARAPQSEFELPAFESFLFAGMSLEP